MEQVQNWIQSLIITVFLISLVDMILPDSSIKRIISIVCSIMLILTIINPLVEVIK